MENTVFTAPGPFARIVAIHFATTIRYAFQIIRDDGVVITPVINENITLSLHTPGNQLLFQGQSQDLSSNQTLDYSEEVDGLTTAFTYSNGYYLIALEPTLLAAHYSMDHSNARCYLTTSGAKTLETIHNRAYLPHMTFKLLAPGVYSINIPLWYQVTQNNQTAFDTLEKTTTIFSSIPYRATMNIVDGQALAYFRLPLLGVIWSAAPDLSGWIGLFDIRDICQGGVTYAPWQYPAGHNPPPEKPENHTDRRYIVYSNVVLKISLSSCPGGWNEIAVDLSSNFGFSRHIPYIQPGEELVNAEHQISDYGKNINGRMFTLTGKLGWNGSGFTYSTGESQVYTNQTATLIESPAMEFDSLTFQPLPE
ncbi:MAG: hypothetical protein HQL70_10125 [Magnetococcales bacterium]|nr:hypothetical protein [Magnetococcales bacterium]